MRLQALHSFRQRLVRKRAALQLGLLRGRKRAV